MARRGQFGRLPRAAPDLTNTLVALLREAAAQEDQNIVSAWKDGGKVDGKGVSDERLLAHMKARRDNLSPDDPMWDEWNNNYIQYDFAIHESKMSLKNDQGKISDSAMAAFYKKWAGREDVQQDSEFYRHLMSQSAKWNEAAKGRSAGNGAANRAAAHEKWRDGYWKEHVKGAETATGYLLLIAQSVGAAPPGANSLDDINPNSTDYAKFQDIMKDGVSAVPEVQDLVNEMNKKIKATNPNWEFSESNVLDLLDRGDRGLKRLVQESTTDGERNDWRGRREGMKYERTRIKQQHANERVQHAADTFATELGDCAGDPYCARNAMKKLRDKLGAESKNIVAGAGGVDPITGKLQDTKTVSALITTIGQLDGALTGKPIPVPAARQAVRGEEPATVPGYTIFDAAAGAEGPTGWVARTLNDVNGDMTRLDNGGWIMTEPMVGQGGAALLDGEGRPRYSSVIYDINTPKPAGAVAVSGAQEMTDTTRATPDGPMAGPNAGVGNTVRHPVTYVQPSEPNVAFEDPVTKQSVDPKRSGDVKMFSGTAQVGPPWVEIRGVKGPDGVARTLYRTGDGTAGNQFLFHEQPPVPATMKPNAAGQFVIPVKSVTPEKGDTYLQADVTPIVAGVKLTRTPKGDSGQWNLGTYESAGATQTSLAIGSLYHTKDPKAGEKTDEYMRQYTRGLEQLPLNDPLRVAGFKDLTQLSQTASLYKRTNGNPTALAAAYDDANRRNPQSQGNADALTKQGLTPERLGKDEFERRVSLLDGIDLADDRLASSIFAKNPDLGGPGGVGRGGPGRGMYAGTLGANAAMQKAELAKARAGVFDPTISVSNIKVPGMPTLMQGGVAPAYVGVGGYMGGYAPQPFGAPGKPVVVASAPKATGPNVSGSPDERVNPVTSTTPKTNVTGPKPTVAPPPTTSVAPKENPTANPTPGIPGSAKRDAGGAYEFINGRKVYY